MKNSWTVKYSGKLDILIFSFAAILLMYTFFIIKYYRREVGDFIEYFLLMPLLLLPITIALIITPFSMVRKKRMVKTIIIDEDNSNINFTFFNKKNPYKLEFNNIAYQKIEKRLFTILVFYEKKIATRGHILYFELHSLFSLYISTSWKREQIYEITKRLKELNIEEHEPIKQKPIIDYIFK